MLCGRLGKTLNARDDTGERERRAFGQNSPKPGKENREPDSLGERGIFKDAKFIYG